MHEYNSLICFLDTRLHDFNVGIMERALTYGETLDPTSYPLCAYHPGAAGSGATVTLSCPPTIGLAVSVLIQIPGSSERLTLCEVQVETEQCKYNWLKGVV